MALQRGPRDCPFELHIRNCIANVWGEAYGCRERASAESVAGVDRFKI